MKITLCNLAFAESPYGPLYHFPMGLLMIATIIKKNSTHGLSIVDIPWLIYSGKIPDDYINYCVNEIMETSPDVVGFYTRCDILPSVILVSKLLKEKSKKIKIVFGGPGATFVASEILNNFKCVDMIILGEGEVTTAELCKAFDLNNSIIDLNSIPGIMYISNGDVIKTRERELICDLREVPLPDYNLINYYKNTSSVASLEAGRGCPYNCSFCSTSNFWRRRYRVKAPAQIVSEMKRLILDFGVKSITLIHDNLIVSPNFIKELTLKINEVIPEAKWRCSGRIDNLSKDIVDMLVESGCESLYLGIETGSEFMQKEINKNLNIKNIDEALAYCEKKGLYTWASFIIGFPKETTDDIDATLKLATNIRQYKTNQVVQVHVLSLEPGSKLFQDNREKLVFTNSFSDHSLFVYDKYNDECIKLIKEYPAVFSSFYSLSNTPLSNIDLNAFCRCAKIFLDFYPKTLKILFTVYSVSPTKLFSYFSGHCKNAGVCASRGFLELADKLCENIECYMKFQQIDFEAPYDSVMLYEKESWKMLLHPYKEIRNLQDINNPERYKVSDVIRILKLDWDPFGVMENLNFNIFDHKSALTYLILIRDRLEAIKTLKVNEETYNLIEYLSSMPSFEINSIMTYYGTEFNEANEIIQFLIKHKIIRENLNEQNNQ